MKDFSGYEDFKAWFDNAASADRMTAKSNPLTLNEICYLIRKAGIDCSVSWRTDDGFKVIPSIKEALIPTRYLQMKMKLVDFEPADPNHYDDSTFKGYVQVDVIPEYLELNIAAPIEKALDDWGRELTDIHTLLGCSELLAGMAEEAAELAQAALKLRRTIDMRNPTPVSTEEASHKLNEEFADVVLCAAALGLDREEVERFIREKAARWSMRLEVDDLGRVVIPREVRLNLGIREGDAFEVLITDDRTGVVFQKYSFDTPVVAALKCLRATVEESELSCRTEFLQSIRELEARLKLEDDA